MRLIDADSMNEELFYKQFGGKDTLITAECAFNMIKAQPTAYNIRLSQKYGFPISEEKYNNIMQWQRTHDAKVHGLRMNHERLAADGARGGRYFYRFVPTSIGVSGECVCNWCNQLALAESLGASDEYREQLEKLGGSYEFQELG